MRVDASETIKDLAQTHIGVLAVTRQVLGQLAALATAEAKATSTFKDRTGNLRGSIQRGEKGPWSLFVKAGGPRARYAVFIEAGSIPHYIPKSLKPGQKMLRFEWGGRMIFRRQVWHPGTKPARFMQSARNASEAVAERYLELGLNAVLR